jgi:hypothetical protein
VDLVEARARAMDPATTPAQLQQIAAEHPELWDAVLAHPALYPDLAAWISAARAAAPPPASSAPRPAHRRALWIGLGAAAAVLLLGGGATAVALALTATPAAPSAAPAEPAPSASPTRSPRITPSPTAAAAVIEYPGEDWEVYGPVLYAPGFDDDMEGGVRGPLEVYVPGEAVTRTLDASRELASREIVSETWTIAESVSGTSGAAVVVVRNPAEGLEPEDYSLHLIVAPLDGSPAASQEMATSCRYSDGASIAGGAGPFVSVSWSEPSCETGFDSVGHSAGWNLDDFSTAWTSEGSLWASTYGSAIVDASTVDGGCDRFVVVDTTAGAIVETLEEGALRGDGSCTDARARTVTDGVLGIHTMYSPVAAVYFGPDGRRISVAGLEGHMTPEMRRDPVTGALLARAEADDASSESGIFAWDPADGEVLYRLGEDEADALQAVVRGFDDGWVYLETSDEQVAVEVATGAVTTRSTDTQVIGRTTGATPYVYLSDGSLVPAPLFSSPLP